MDPLQGIKNQHTLIFLTVLAIVPALITCLNRLWFQKPVLLKELLGYVFCFQEPLAFIWMVKVCAGQPSAWWGSCGVYDFQQICLFAALGLTLTAITSCLKPIPVKNKPILATFPAQT